MIVKYMILAMAALVLVDASAFGQSDEELEARMREAEARLQEREAEMERVARQAERERAELEAERAQAMREMERERAEAMERMEHERAAQEAERAEVARESERMRVARQAEMETRGAELAARMREAEAALAEAAQQVADLSMQQLPRVAEIERQLRIQRGPVLGITIGGDSGDEPVEGVEILGVTPGGAAADAGLRGGDVLTSINGEVLTADNSWEAKEKLLDFMGGVEEGDVLDVEYLRNGRTESVEVEPRGVRGGMYAFSFDGKDFTVPQIEVAPHVAGNTFVWNFGGHAWGDMELVSLTEDLGRYFGTEEGLLVVRAPEDEELKLEDGDVIQSIDGRKPTSVAHAMRILGSYQGGETLEIEIMRDKRKQKITIEMPDKRQSYFGPGQAPDVDVQVVPMPASKIIVKQGERT